MRSLLPRRRNLPELQAGNVGMILTLFAWGVLLIAGAWIVAFVADNPRGHHTSTGAITRARQLAGEGADNCGAMPYQAHRPALECAHAPCAKAGVSGSSNTVTGARRSR